MVYGLYLSAMGVLSNSYRQDVIANNIANAETVGFKRDLAIFQQRRTEARFRHAPDGRTNPALEPLGGGVMAGPTSTDRGQGELEPTGSALDAAIVGRGYFMVEQGGQQRLTRDGRFMVSRGYLVLADGGQRVLDSSRKPIALDPTTSLEIGQDGQITQAGQPGARIGVFDVPAPEALRKLGGSLYAHPDVQRAVPAEAVVRSGFVERSNVEPATELAQLMESQRQLEANANMIRYQDQTLARLVNDVGRIS